MKLKRVPKMHQITGVEFVTGVPFLYDGMELRYHAGGIYKKTGECFVQIHDLEDDVRASGVETFLYVGCTVFKAFIAFDKCKKLNS